MLKFAQLATSLTAAVGNPALHASLTWSPLLAGCVGPCSWAADLLPSARTTKTVAGPPYSTDRSSPRVPHAMHRNGVTPCQDTPPPSSQSSRNSQAPVAPSRQLISPRASRNCGKTLSVRCRRTGSVRKFNHCCGSSSCTSAIRNCSRPRCVMFGPPPRQYISPSASSSCSSSSPLRAKSSPASRKSYGSRQPQEPPWPAADFARRNTPRIRPWED